MTTRALRLHTACTAARRPYPLCPKPLKFTFRPCVNPVRALSRRQAAVICQALNFGQQPTEPTPSSVKLSTLDTKQRRRLLVQFTCNKCGTRSERLVNPVAYQQGTVFVQCQGCEAWHKLVDNMGLIEEYDLRDMPLSEKGEELLASLQASERDTESDSASESHVQLDSQPEAESESQPESQSEPQAHRTQPSAQPEP